MKTLFLTTAAFAALVMIAPIGNAHAAPGDGGYHQASGFEQVKAECELVANGLQPSPGFAIGSAEFVAGHEIGATIGGLIVHARNYDNCMTLHGYAKNDGSESAPAAPAYSQPSYAAPAPTYSAPRRTTRVKTAARAPHDYIDDLPISAYEKCGQRLTHLGRFAECEANPNWDGK